MINKIIKLYQLNPKAVTMPINQLRNFSIKKKAIEDMTLEDFDKKKLKKYE